MTAEQESPTSPTLNSDTTAEKSTSQSNNTSKSSQETQQTTKGQESPEKLGGKDYESSELSDLSEDQSEAETDKMDFLEENTTADGGLDLNTLLELTRMSRLKEMARLREIDSDDDDESVDKKKLDPEKNNGAKKPLVEKASVSRNNKRRSGADEKDAKRHKSKKEDADGSIDDTHEADGEDEGYAEDDPEKDELVTDAEVPADVPENGKIEEPADAEEPEEPEEAEGEPDEPENENAEVEEQEEHSEEDDNDEDVDINEQRVLAVQELGEIEKLFAEVRDKLFHDKLKFLEHELQLCLGGSHPELARIYYKINGFYQDSVRLANHTLSYRLRCINNETIATRTSIHQDFLKQMVDKKNDMILETTSKWYKINKERNQMDQLVPDFAYKPIPDIKAESREYGNEEEYNGYTNGYLETPEYISKKERKQAQLFQLVQQRNDYNQGLGIVNGLIQLHGIPSAIDLLLDDKSGPRELLLLRANDEEIAEDLRTMGII